MISSLTLKESVKKTGFIKVDFKKLPQKRFLSSNIENVLIVNAVPKQKTRVRDCRKQDKKMKQKKKIRLRLKLIKVF